MVFKFNPNFTIKPFIPKYLDLELTNGCPADCPMCPRDKLPNIGIMSDNTFYNVLKNIKDTGTIQFISLCGIGEALIHPKVFDYIKEIKTLPNPPILGIVTGGEKLTPEVFEKLKSLKVDIIELSLQTINKELYKKLMPGLKLEKVLENIDYASKNVHKDMRFSLNIVVHKLNKDYINELINFAKEKKLLYAIRKIHSRGGNLLNPSLNNDPEINQYKNMCKIFELINFVGWDGKIQLCCQDAAREFVIGDINKESLIDIAKRKNEILFKQGLTYRLCEKCDDELRFVIK